MKKYKVIRSDRSSSSLSQIKKDQILYENTKPDYGCASDDTREHGTTYISVTVEPDGSPFFTIPLQDLEEL